MEVIHTILGGLLPSQVGHFRWTFGALTRRCADAGEAVTLPCQDHLCRHLPQGFYIYAGCIIR